MVTIQGARGDMPVYVATPAGEVDHRRDLRRQVLAQEVRRQHGPAKGGLEETVVRVGQFVHGACREPTKAVGKTPTAGAAIRRPRRTKARSRLGRG
jgi:hypothetical protein